MEPTAGQIPNTAQIANRKAVPFERLFLRYGCVKAKL